MIAALTRWQMGYDSTLDSMAQLKAVVKLMLKEPLTESFRMALDPASVKMQLLQQVKTW